MRQSTKKPFFHGRLDGGADGNIATPIDSSHDLAMKRAITVSAVFHITLFVVFAVRAVIYPSTPMIIEESVRVDIVGLPDKKSPKAALPPPPAASEAKPAAEKKPEPIAETKPQPKVEKPVLPDVVKKPETPAVNLNKAKQDQASALKRLEALQKLEKMAQKDAAKPAPESASASSSTSEEKGVQSAVIKGNEISPGTALTGIARLTHQSYLSSVQQYAKRQWNLPQWLANGDFSARVRIYLDSRGYVVKREITRSSNNPTYDERVLLAIDASSPFPSPPSDLVNVIAVDGIEVDFVP